MADNLFLLTLAILPGFALALFIYIRDHLEPEPVSLLMLAYVLGAAVFLICLIPGEFLRNNIENQPDILEVKAIHAFASVAFVEELGKFFIVRFILYPNQNFNEPMDGIVYSVMVGLGFASLENVFYVVNEGSDAGFLRMFSAIPAHAMFAVVMGYYLGIARFSCRFETAFALLGLLAAVVLHGTYDYFLFISFIPGMWVGAVFTMFLAAWMAFRSLRIHQAASPFKKD